MKGYELNVIVEHISTAMITEDPEETLFQTFLYVLSELVDTDYQHEILEYLYQSEKNMEIRKQ
jgi:recombinational DNA repair protein (RecF pathway)